MVGQQLAVFDPLPSGAIISIILSVKSGVGFSCSNLKRDSGIQGRIRSSKFILFFTKI